MNEEEGKTCWKKLSCNQTGKKVWKKAWKSNKAE